MKYLIIGLLVLASGMFYFMHQSNKASAERLKQAEIAHQQKLDAEKAKLIKEQQAKSKKAETDVLIKELQEKYSMDYLDAKQIIESEKMSQKDKGFYVDLAGRWVDALNVAGATSRISLSQPVKDLQEIRRKLSEKQTTTYCEGRMKKELLKSYDFAIDGFLNFMHKNEILSSGFMALSKSYQQNANTLIDYC
ncbi:hypothetical protein [Acinetobacter variabilis]|uniref:hypothetical protein n=1 Tax=Acinetobacter variabilis TaxID=70346 RepID=UPI00289D55F9|nr:hypothetical protein [Acinetobacter variabilis]